MQGPSSDHSWNPTKTSTTTTLDYWWNWRVLVCAIWVLLSMIISSILIWKYEGPEKANRDQEPKGIIYKDESWRPCFNGMHPVWLLGFRMLSFASLLIFFVAYIVKEGNSSFYYYTQWTFMLVIAYFALGSLLSLHGCRQFTSHGGRVVGRSDEEGGVQNHRHHEEQQSRQIAGFWSYVFQIIFQTNAGAVMLTDCVFWLLMVPFLEAENYDLNILTMGMHSLNAIFLLIDISVNSMRFPWFRISYFTLWTAIYVIFQWIVHACVSTGWPYPFLDLSSKYSPIWYLVVGVMHVPCYGFFIWVLQMKSSFLLKRYPTSYQHSNNNELSNNRPSQCSR